MMWVILGIFSFYLFWAKNLNALCLTVYITFLKNIINLGAANMDSERAISPLLDYIYSDLDAGKIGISVFLDL